MPPIWAPLLGIGSAVAMALTLGAIVLRIHQLHFRLQILDRECRSNSIVLDLLFPIRTDDGLLRHLRWTDWVPLLLPVACLLLWGLLMLLPVAEGCLSSLLEAAERADSVPGSVRRTAKAHVSCGSVQGLGELCGGPVAQEVVVGAHQ